MMIKYLFRSPQIPDDAKQLEALAEKLGVSLYGTWDGRALDTAEVQARILAMLNHHRSSSLWLIAFLSALASLASAVAAWTAVALRP